LLKKLLNGVAFETISSDSVGFNVPPAERITPKKATDIKTYPINAGLKILYPNPPNNSLPITLVKMEPKTSNHIGVFNGKIIASNTPGIIAYDLLNLSQIFSSLKKIK